jgi:hypothetical protein
MVRRIAALKDRAKGSRRYAAQTARLLVILFDFKVA